MERLKDPFFTTKDTGTGLGLAIVGSIIEGHGGQWTLSCGVEGGARVDMIFPAK
jgi:nitrogen fixation/metabolism regulation signal transduction histidine kinase